MESPSPRAVSRLGQASTPFDTIPGPQIGMSWLARTVPGVAGLGGSEMAAEQSAELVIGLVGVMAALAAVARWLSVPYPVLLSSAG